MTDTDEVVTLALRPSVSPTRKVWASSGFGRATTPKGAVKPAFVLVVLQIVEVAAGRVA